MYEITRYMEANTMGTAILLEHLSRGNHSVQKLIVASSMSIYGEGAYVTNEGKVVYPSLRSPRALVERQWDRFDSYSNSPLVPIATNENKPIRPTSIYAISKRDQEEMSGNRTGL
jgi:dTDP-L-rhamnose 4-epimerase